MPECPYLSQPQSRACMAELPTEEELEKLYHEKGRDALIWYVWRNTLRALSILGRHPLQNILGGVNNIYSVVSIPLILGQWHDNPVSVTNLSTQLADKVLDLYSLARSTQASDLNAGARSASRAIRVMARSLKVIDSVVNHHELASSYSSQHVAFGFDKYAKADYSFLLKNNVTDDTLKSRSLWIEVEEINEVIPANILEWNNSLLHNLHEIGLDFLAHDIEKLWVRDLPSPYVENYLKDLSQVVLDDPFTLRRAIVLGEYTEKLYANRVLLLGSGGAGKSTLASRLRGNSSSYVPMTLGIDYLQHEKLNLRKEFPIFDLDDRKLDLYIWDFGGQTIFHGLHSAFLHENCVYVLVVDSRHEQAPDEWLYQIRHLAGTQAKILRLFGSSRGSPYM